MVSGNFTHPKKVSKKLVFLCVSALLLAGGATVFANDKTIGSSVDATSITGSNMLNTVTISDNSTATITNGDKTWTLENTAKANEWDTIKGGTSIENNFTEALESARYQPMGNRINITGNSDLTIQKLIGGEVTKFTVMGNQKRVVNDNIITISGSGTLKADEIIGGYRSYDIKYDSVHQNVINIEGKTIIGRDGGTVYIYGGKVGYDVWDDINNGNVEYGIINISGTAKLDNAYVSTGYTNVQKQGGHILNGQINLSSDADVSSSSLFGAQRPNHSRNNNNERNNVLNIGYKNNISTNLSGITTDPDTAFAVGIGGNDNGTQMEDNKGTYLVQTPEVSTWNNNTVKEIGEFTAIKIWSMDKKPALFVKDNASFKYTNGSSRWTNQNTVIDLSYLTSGKDFGTYYKEDLGQNYDKEGGAQSEGREDEIDLTKDGVDSSNILLASVKPNATITIIETANSDLTPNEIDPELLKYGYTPGTPESKIYYNPLVYGYKIQNSSGSNVLNGTYKGWAEINVRLTQNKTTGQMYSPTHVYWKTGDITVNTISFPNLILDGSGKPVNPITLEKYNYIFNNDTALSMGTISKTGNSLISPSDSFTLIDGSGAQSVTGLENLKGGTDRISYTLDDGAVSATASGTMGITDDNKNLTYSLGNPETITYHSLDWTKTAPMVTLDAGKTYDLSQTAIDTSAMQMKGLSSLKRGVNMRTLLTVNGHDAGIDESKLTDSPIHITLGSTLEGTGRALLQDGDLVYRADMDRQPQTHKTLLGQEAGLAALIESNDLILDTMKNLDKSADGIEAFGTVGGGENRYETGSHITTNLWRGQAGFARKDSSKKGSSWEYGLSYDYGDGSYRTFYRGTGNGKINYKGAGIFGKYIRPDGFYGEASFRMGRASNDAKNILHGELGRPYRYRTDSLYNAFHVGIGRISDRGHGNSLDTYLRFFHTHLNGDTFEAGGHYDIDSLESNLARIGTRWQHKDHRFEYYAGLAYEYEFSGKAYGIADGMDIESASIRGGSVRFEYGASVDTGKWRVAINGSDYAGKRKGFNGNLSLTCRVW